MRTRRDCLANLARAALSYFVRPARWPPGSTLKSIPRRRASPVPLLNVEATWTTPETLGCAPFSYPGAWGSMVAPSEITVPAPVVDREPPCPAQDFLVHEGADKFWWDRLSKDQDPAMDGGVLSPRRARGRHKVITFPELGPPKARLRYHRTLGHRQCLLHEKGNAWPSAASTRGCGAGQLRASSMPSGRSQRCDRRRADQGKPQWRRRASRSAPWQNADPCGGATGTTTPTTTASYWTCCPRAVTVCST